MKRNLVNYLNFLPILFLFFYFTPLEATYKEGTDTTDINGYGLNSAFQISNGSINGNVIAHYCFDQDWCRGYYRYTFDDIIIAPDSVMNGYADKTPFYCFIVKNPEDNTYSKVQVLHQISENRYLYRFGTNTVPNDRTLTKPISSGTPFYKVCNLFYTGIPYPLDDGPGAHTEELSWDNPPSNAPQPIKYIFYTSKSNVRIDTTVPINPSQWDSVIFPGSSPKAQFKLPGYGYFNMIAVYSNGRSDFLSGWTICAYDIMSARGSAPRKLMFSGDIITKRMEAGLFIFFPRTSNNAEPASAYIFSPTGRKIADLPLSGSTAFWIFNRTSYVSGSYIVRSIYHGGGSFEKMISLFH